MEDQNKKNEQMVLGEVIEPVRSDEEEKLRGTIKNVKKLLEENPGLRDSDRKLIWKYWDEFDGIVYFDRHGTPKMEFKNFLEHATDIATIMRCARKVRQRWPELRGKGEIEKRRDSKRKTFEKTLGKDRQDF